MGVIGELVAAEKSQKEESERLSDLYADRFSGVGRVYGEAGLKYISQAHVCIVGLGGVGTWSAEALVRSGVGEISLIDLDEICVTNINRQLHALTSTVGQSKVDVMAQRLRDINPEVVVHTHQKFFTPKTEEELLGPSGHTSRFDVLVDAIDYTERKILLIESCLLRGVPVVTCGAAGGRSAPQMVTCADLSESTHDGLLRNVRRALRKRGKLGSLVLSEKTWGVPAVFSTERPIYPDGQGGVCHTPLSTEALRLSCDFGFGSLSFVTGTFGFVAASIAIDLIVQNASRIHQQSVHPTFSST